MTTDPQPTNRAVRRRSLSAMLAALLVGGLLVACAAAEPNDGPPDASDKQGANHDAAAGADEDGTSDATEPATEAERLLAELEARGQKIDSYKAAVVYTREQRLLGDKQTRLGDVAYLAGDPDQDKPARFAVRFDKLVVGRALRERQRYFIFDGKWLAEIDPDRKQFIRRQVVGPNERFDPLKLGEGPFPLPLGQNRQRVLRVFEAEVLPLTDEERASKDLSGTRHLRLTPRTAPDSDRKLSDFDRVDIWYDAESLLPRKVVTIEGEREDEANVTTVLLRKAALNTLDRAEDADLFQTTPPRRGSGWHVEIKPLEDD